MISRSFTTLFVALFVAAGLFAACSRLPASRARGPSTTELEDRAAIQNLVVKYTIALDTLDADMYASVFAEDAEFTFGGKTTRAATRSARS